MCRVKDTAPHERPHQEDETLMTDLARRHCAPCNAETPPIEGSELQRYMEHLNPRWQVVEEHHLAARFEFADFAEALAFTNQVGAIAEAEGHHPELSLSWGWVRAKIWTHAIDGLSENDFIRAARIDELVGAPAGEAAS
jgi:4a-hydroxytetrahydrobiopterin dehydratase